MSAPTAYAQRAIVDGGGTDAAVADASLQSPHENAEHTDESVASRVLGNPDDDLPDPVAEDGERSGTLEGEAIPETPMTAHEIAALSDAQCLRVLRRAEVPFELSDRQWRGISQPIWITGPIGGVTYRGSGHPRVRELVDCRLAVALVRFSRLLRAVHVHTLIHLSTYRAPTESEAQRRPVQTRHPGGMAIDAGSFVLDDGRTFSVLADFHGRMRRPVCGPMAHVPRDEGARLLRTIACDSARRGIFHVVLTPNFNRPHRNHFHLEITRGVQWQYVH
ncbi:MAG: extensin family protein [Deltaproteobacteria bacterium]|nr:extensin family protein [Deltaproteobacteria bacterium]